MVKNGSIVVEADPNDPEDFPVDQAAIDKAQIGRRIRMLRSRLGLSRPAFAERYGIPVASLHQYEIGRHMPPPAVRAYLTVIEREPDIVAAAFAAAA